MREAGTGPAGPAGLVPKRPILWRILRALLAVAIPPMLPYLAILLMPPSTLGRINAALGWDMQTAMFAFVMPAMAIVILGWIVGALRAWQSRNGVGRVWSWLALFAAIGFLPAAALVGLTGFFEAWFVLPLGFVSGMVIGILMWAALRWLP
jgi:hypothetical protein